MIDALKGAAEVVDRIPDKLWHFKELKEEVWQMLYGRWGKIYSPDDLNAALSIMVDMNTLEKHLGVKVTYYTVNRADPLFERSIP